MADANPTATNPSDESALHILGDALDAHAWRAESFAGALYTMANSDITIEPAHLVAVTDALEDHVKGLTAAMREAHELLAGRKTAA